MKTGHQKYHDTFFSRSGVIQMSIFKNSEDLLGTLRSRSQHGCNNNKLIDFSIPPYAFKSRIKELIQCFLPQKCSTPVTHLRPFTFPPLRQLDAYQYPTRLYTPTVCRRLHNNIYSQRPTGYQERN